MLPRELGLVAFDAEVQSNQVPTNAVDVPLNRFQTLAEVCVMA
jgi:hypothetical protein